MTSDARKRAALKYQKNAVRQLKFNFVKTTDADILAYLDASGNRAGTVKKAIREYMQKHPIEPENKDN